MTVVALWWMLKNFVVALIEPIAFIVEELDLNAVPEKKPYPLGTAALGRNSMKLTSVNEINIETLREYNRLNEMLNRFRASDYENIVMEFRDDKGLYGTLVVDRKEAMEFLNKRIKALGAKIKSF